MTSRDGAPTSSRWRPTRRSISSKLNRPSRIFRADTEWRDYRAHCDRLFFAIPETVPIEIMPQDAGLILADSNGAEILREAPEHRMAAATRR
jgi:hypothetical protein